jgi:hypothetical protein
MGRRFYVALFLTLFVATAMLTAGGSAQAQTEAPAKTSDKNALTAEPAAPAPNATQKSDIDDEITNARLRASTGSKSPFSVSTALNYNGGSVAKPFDAVRPKLSPGTLNQEPSLLGGTVAVKYRLTEHDNLNLGLGVNWVNPGHGDTYRGGQFIEHGEAADPYLAYTRLFKWAGLQNVFNLQIQYYTDKAATDNNDTFESDIDHTFLYEIGKTGLQLGIDIGWTHDFYSSYNVALKDKLGSAVDEVFAYPFLEYEFTKMFSFRTVYRGLTYFSTQQAPWTFARDAVTQSAGIGIAVTRDVYLYPNVQWVWSDIDAKKTNIALSTNINLF